MAWVIKSGGVGARVGGLRARLVWEGAARGALAACAAERRALCAAGQRGGGVGAHARRINSYGVAVFAKPRSGGEGSVGIPHPMYPPWANHGTLELLYKCGIARGVVRTAYGRASRDHSHSCTRLLHGP